MGFTIKCYITGGKQCEWPRTCSKCAKSMWISISKKCILQSLFGLILQLLTWDNDHFCMLHVFFQDREAHGVFLVSVCSPVNCITCHGLDISIISVSRRRTAGFPCFSLPRRMLLPQRELAQSIGTDRQAVPTYPQAVNTWIERVLLTI